MMLPPMWLAMLSRLLNLAFSAVVAFVARIRLVFAKLASCASLSSSNERLEPTVSRKQVKSVPPRRFDEVLYFELFFWLRAGRPYRQAALQSQEVVGVVTLVAVHGVVYEHELRAHRRQGVPLKGLGTRRSLGIC
jgi:hypothetical protein